jgi:excisionase family DNA binding protein
MPKARGGKGGEKNNATPRPMLTLGEASKILAIHSNTLRGWSDQGIITAYRIGPRHDRRFRREDVAALLVKATQHSAKEMRIKE